MNKEIELLKQIALKALEMFESDDLWIDGVFAGSRADELETLVKQWQTIQQATIQNSIICGLCGRHLTMTKVCIPCKVFLDMPSA